MATKKKLLQAAAGSASGGAGALNVEQVFSTYLYEGNGSTQTIINDINLGQSFSGTGSDGSALFGGNGDYVTVSGLSSSISGDFTIELFGYNTSPASEEHVLLGPWGDGTHGNQILVRFVGERLDVAFPSKEVNLAKSIHGIGRNEWFHLAITRSSGTLRIFANGAKVHESSYSTTIDLGTLYIGSERSPFTLNGNWEGNISNVRVSDTTAFYTSNFTLPTANLTNISNTDLLTLQGSTPFVDNSSNSLTVTDGGSVSAASGGPFPVVDGEGGLVWCKKRNDTTSHGLFDTERGATKQLDSSVTTAQETQNGGLTSFNSNGFTVGNSNVVNGGEQVSWTFRKAPKFFDVVTYTGDGVAGREIAHNLGAEVGMMIIKSTSIASSNWIVYHRSNANTEFMYLNGTAAKSSALDWFNSTTPTTTSFTVNNYTKINGSGETFVAYLFAHNDGDGDFGPTEDQDIIKCGSYSGNGSASGPSINLGFEPQWLLVKRADDVADWLVWDAMRGAGSNNTVKLQVNTSNAEDTLGEPIGFNATGFQPLGADSEINNGSGTYIYIAIRRGPMAVPTDATDVFDVELANATTTNGVEFQTGWPLDFAWFKDRDTGTEPFTLLSRLQGNTRYMYSSSTGAETTGVSYGTFDHSDGWYSSTLPSDYYSCMWRRAPNFFDVVAYTGDGVAGRTVSHNLGVAPEMMWVKRRSTTGAWAVYHKGLNGGTNPEDYFLVLNSSQAETTGSYWNNTAPTDSVITFNGGSVANASGHTYIAYLFASLDGVSKVGSVDHVNGTRSVVDCGFSNGARFVIFKYVDSNTGLGGDPSNWHVFDTERGIIGGIDARLSLNTTDAEINTGNDYIDPDSSGFSLPGGHPSGTYIFYAIA